MKKEKSIIKEDEHLRCLNRYLDEQLNKKIMSKNSIRSRISAVRRFLEFIESEGVELFKITHIEINRFYICKKELSDHTRTNRARYLKDFLKFCLERNEISELDFDKLTPPKDGDSEVFVFNKDELKNLLQTIKTSKQKGLILRDTIWFSIIILTGCTFDDFCKIKIFVKETDVNINDYYLCLAKRSIVFLQERKFNLPHALCDEIERYTNECNFNSGYSILKSNKSKNGMYTDKTVQARFSTIKKESIFKNKGLSIKDIRHTIVCFYLQRNIRYDIVCEKFNVDYSSLKQYAKVLKDLQNKNELQMNELKKIDEYIVNIWRDTLGV